MHIAQLTWPDNAMPPVGYGPVQLVAANLANGLIDAGHRVTTFTADSSTVKGDRINICSRPSRGNPDASTPDTYRHILLREMMAHKDDFDIIHSHINTGTIVFLELTSTPVIITLHGNYLHTPDIRECYKKYAQKAFFVASSDFQKQSLPDVNYLGTVYHGIDTSRFAFGSEADDYMLYVGRTFPTKGLAIAIQVALKTKKRLKIIAKTENSDEAKNYYDNEVKPYLDSEFIEYLGEIAQEELPQYYQKAKLLIFPTEAEEAFGLVVAEAAASGTPTVSYAKGALSEIIGDGQSGYLVNRNPEEIRGDWAIKNTGIDGLVEAVLAIYNLDATNYAAMRQSANRQATEKFSIEAMVKGYIEIYNRVL